MLAGPPAHCRCSRRSTSAGSRPQSRAARPRRPPSICHAVTPTALTASAAWASLPWPRLSIHQCSHGARLRPPCASPPEHQPAEARARLAVFVSGGGSNFKAIHAACQGGTINADVVAVVSDVPTCGGVQYAQQHGIPTFTYPVPKKGSAPGLSTEDLVQQLTQEARADYVLLAGYLKLVPAELVRCYKRAMLNVHPGLLPSFGGKGFYGQRVHQAVLASGARFSGPTVHFVDEEYDTGPILAQRVVPAYPTDTPQQLAARVLKQEHLVYPEAVSALVDKRITWRSDGIPIMWSAH